MMGTGSVMVMTVTTLLLCCCVYSHQEQDVSMNDHSRNSYEHGHKARSLNPLDVGQLVRQVREAHRISYPLPRRNEYASLTGGKRYPWLFVPPIEYGYYGEGLPKRNFDEIDRSSLNSFVKKRNFDEIDQTSMPFPYKRFYPMNGINNMDTADGYMSMKRYKPDYPMDEIDLSQFPIGGSKRSAEVFSINNPLR